MVIVLLVVRRSYAMSQGVPYSAARLLLSPALLLVLWGLTEAGSVLLIPWALPYLIVLDAAVLVVAALLFAGTAEHQAEVYRSGGGWNYRIRFSVTAVFLALYLLRLVLAVAIVPQSLEYGVVITTHPPLYQQATIAVIDALLSVSIGLLVGRAIGVARKVRATEGAPAPGPA